MLTEETNKALVLTAFDVLFNQRDYKAAAQYFPDGYIQHSTQMGPGRDSLFDRVRSMPATFHYENQFAVADGDYVMLYGRFTGNGRPAAMINADVFRIQDGKLAEHWDVSQDEATRAQTSAACPCSATSSPTNHKPPTCRVPHGASAVPCEVGYSRPERTRGHHLH